MTRTDRLNITVAWLLVILLAVCALTAGVVSAGTAYAESDSPSDAVTAAQWGNIDADGLWYMAAEELNLPALRKYVSESMLPALQAANAEPVVIAVIDTGINRANGLFDDVLLRDGDGNVMGYCSYYPAHNGTYTQEQLNSFDDETSDKHGTRIASIMAVFIKELGLEDYIKIYPIKASYPSAVDSSKVNEFTIASIKQAIEHAVSDEVGADVINLSLASTSDKESTWANDTTMKNTIAEAVSKATVVAAAGNNSTNSNNTKYYPAAYDGVVGVMASAEGNTYHATTNYGSAYDIFAPGENIMTSAINGTYIQDDNQSGTSLAAPMVSVAATLLKLRFRADRAATGEAVPRATVLTRLITDFGEGDLSVTAKDGNEYKKLDIYGLISADYSDFEGEYMPVSQLVLSATRYGGSEIDVSQEVSLAKCTIRENGRSSVTFEAKTVPYGDTDPAYDADIVWTVETYEEVTSGDTTTQKLVSTAKAGQGKTLEYLFDTPGIFKVYATLTVDGNVFVTDKATFRVSYSTAYYDRMYIVPADYLTGSDYIAGNNGAIPRAQDLYGKDGITLTVTTLEDLEPQTITWYVNGEIAAQYVPAEGATSMNYEFLFKPSSFGEYKITAVFGDGKVNGVFTVDYKSYAEHPDFVPVWCALAVWVVMFAVIGVCLIRKHKENKSGRQSAATGTSEENDKPESPIRKK